MQDSMLKRFRILSRFGTWIDPQSELTLREMSIECSNWTLHASLCRSSLAETTPYTPHTTPHTLTPSTLPPTPHTLTPYTLYPTPYTLHPTPYMLHPTPYTLHPTPYPTQALYSTAPFLEINSRGHCRLRRGDAVVPERERAFHTKLEKWDSHDASLLQEKKPRNARPAALERGRAIPACSRNNFGNCSRNSFGNEGWFKPVDFQDFHAITNVV